MEKIKQEYQEQLIKLRRDFHQHPEPGWCEFRTSSLVIKKLKELGYEVSWGKKLFGHVSRMGVPPLSQLAEYERLAVENGADPSIVSEMSGGYTGAVAFMDFGDGPTVGFRFDIDCVQINESQTSEHRPYREGFCSQKEGVAHSCGHDGHTAIGLVFAEWLLSKRSELSGKVFLIFQPAEEGVRGAAAILESAVLPRLDYIIGGHLGLGSEGINSFSAGSYGFLATEKWDIQLKGKAAHAGNAPEKGRNALLAASNIAINLYAISRSGEGGTFVNVGRLSAGSYRNIIPESAELQIELRGDTAALNDYMCQRSREIIEGISKAFEVECEIEAVGRSISTESSEKLAELIQNVVSELNLYENVAHMTRIVGSDDFSLLMQHVVANGGEGCYMLWGADIKNPLHSGGYDFDEEALIKALQTLTAVTTRIMLSKKSG